MIIVFSSSSEINQRAADALVAKCPQRVFESKDISNQATETPQIDPNDDTITIIDLRADGNIQKNYSAKELAERLKGFSFLDNVTMVQLLISDVVADKSLLGYGTRFSETLIEVAPERNITVCAPGDVVHCTLIEPPEEPDGNWTIYTGPYPTGCQPNFESYKSRLRLTFNGAIEEALKNPAYVINSETVRTKLGISIT